VRIQGPFARIDQAWSEARCVIDGVTAGGAPLAIIGDFVIPPACGPSSRDFQTLHFDFGLPLVPVRPTDVACFTALHVPAEMPASDAVTRLVPLRRLLAGRRWPNHDELVQRLTAYGHSHGARDDAAGYTEGSLARLIEAALGDPPALPSLKTDSGFLCGNEFVSAVDELEFFAERSLRVEAVEIDVRLRPGELLIFDNLVLAHGRRGARQPGELHQRVFGHQLLPVEQQTEIRARVLTAFR
jgi:Taurine catabolism dioxygenase TauD, TfdA family